MTQDLTEAPPTCPLSGLLSRVPHHTGSLYEATNDAVKVHVRRQQRAGCQGEARSCSGDLVSELKVKLKRIQATMLTKIRNRRYIQHSRLMFRTCVPFGLTGREITQLEMATGKRAYCVRIEKLPSKSVANCARQSKQNE
jgi:hypothetical protein